MAETATEPENEAPTTTSAPTFVSEIGRGPCSLAVPDDLMDARSGTLTLEEYRAWSESRYGR